MNINDIKQVNNTKFLQENSKQQIKQSNSDFSSYVNLNEDENIQNSLNDENNDLSAEKNILVNPDMVCVQTFQMMSNEVFDMGIKNSSLNNDVNNIFATSINLADLTKDDIDLFDNIIKKNDISVNSFNAQSQTFNLNINGENTEVSYKSIEVSKTIFDAVENAAKTGKSVRLDFGSDTSVILKIGRDGKLSADFIPNDKAVEQVLKNALPSLKLQFEENNIPYGNLNYKSFNKQQNNKQDNKEKNKDE